MRTRLTSRISLLFMAFALVLALPAMALADDISNNVDATVDATAEVMALQAGGSNGATQLSVIPTDGDGKNGCNLTGSTMYSASVDSSNASVATVSPSSVTFTSCGDVKTLTVTPLAQGSTTISLTETGNTTGRTFNLAPATFTVNVSAPPPSNTPPQVMINGVTGGANYEKGSVPSATCEVTDAEDGNSSFAATIDSSQLNQYGLGQETASCSYTDNGPGPGLTASSSETYNIVDTGDPTSSHTLSSAANSNGWHNANVTVTLDADDGQNGSGIKEIHYSATGDQTISDRLYDDTDKPVISTEGTTTFSYYSVDNAGNESTHHNFTIKLDKTAPQISGANVNNTTWRNTDLSEDFTASDSRSGLANAADANFTLTASDESADASTPTTDSKTVSDLAGNSSTRTLSALIDKTKPEITVGNPTSQPNAAGWYNSKVTNDFSASDGLSGLADSAQASFQKSSGDSEEGSAVLISSGTVADVAGNVADAKNAGPFKIDMTAPSVSASVSPAAAATGWYNIATGAPTVKYTCSDGLSGLDGTCPADHTFGEGTNQSHSSGDVYDLAGNKASASVSDIDVDLTAPSQPTAGFDRAPEDSVGGYFKDTVTVSYSGSSDALSGLATPAYSPASETFNTTGSHNYSGVAKDNAGNVSDAASGTVKVDATPPSLELTCPTATVIKGSSASANWTASDGESGLSSAATGSVSLNTSTVGTQTASVPAGTAQDKVGHGSAADTCSYSVVFNFAGFRAPVDNGGIFNAVKAGQSIPMKFSLSGNQGLGIIALGYPKAMAVTCPNSTALVDQIEETTTANNGLTYDATADQYNYVWKTQSTYAGKCYRFDMKLTDGTTNSAFFKFTK